MLFLILITGLSGCEQREGFMASVAEVPVEVSVMTFNIEWGGMLVSYDNVLDAIRRSNVDIVGIQEAEGNLRKIAADLGWHYDRRSYVVSKFPLIDPPGANGKYVFAEVTPGKVVVVANVHLPSDPYGPDIVRDGGSPAAVLKAEQGVRMPAIRTVLDSVAPILATRTPLIMTGDFNAPAHSDWTSDTVGTRPFLRYALQWPVSTAILAAGLRDSWRDVFPDPVANPGLTWWASRPPLESYAPGEGDAQDRIDFIWYAGDAEVTSSYIVGETDGPEVSLELSPWPSDHRAVVSGFRLLPGDMPELASPEHHVYRAGEPVAINVNSRAADLIEIRDAGSGELFVEIPIPIGRSTQHLPTLPASPGHYRVVMQSRLDDELSSWFRVLPQDSDPVVAIDREKYVAGEDIKVRWQDAPGNRNDYLAVYGRDTETNYDNGMAWTYVDALPSGNTMLDSSGIRYDQGLKTGEFVVRLIEDDGFETLAESTVFRVVSPLEVANDVATFADGRLPIGELFAAYQTLVDRGWHLDLVTMSAPGDVDTPLPVVALRSPVSGEAVWILAGIHGEEPAGPNAIAATVDDIALLGEQHAVVLMPLLNPHGYVRNWRYLNTPTYTSDIAGQSVGDSSHLLPRSNGALQSIAAVSNREADAITRYILETVAEYPPRYSIDLHEDNLVDAGYVYSQGALGASDPLARMAVEVFIANGIGIKMDGMTRFDEPIVNGIIGPVSDSSIDELMSSSKVLVDGEFQPGPDSRTVLVFETPAAMLALDERVNAHKALIETLLAKILANR